MTTPIEYVQSYNHPVAVFRFKYRCKGIAHAHESVKRWALLIENV